jgi:hypothetical protein
MAASATAIAADNDPDPGQFSQETCNAILETIGELRVHLAMFNSCGLPQCVIVTFDLRMAIQELENAWADGGCAIYPAPIRRNIVPTHIGASRS